MTEPKPLVTVTVELPYSLVRGLHQRFRDWTWDRIVTAALMLALIDPTRAEIVAGLLSGPDETMAPLLDRDHPGGCEHCAATHRYQPEGPGKYHIWVTHAADCARPVAEDG
jgi:hypothetical protein